MPKNNEPKNKTVKSVKQKTTQIRDNFKVPSFPMTQIVIDKLTKDLDELKEYRVKVIQQVKDARAEGDLKENGGYHAARSEQRKVDSKIKEIEFKLRYKKLIESKNQELVSLGQIIKLKFNGKARKFVLGDKDYSDLTDLEVRSPNSPLGQAILDQKVGAKLTFTAPNGKENQIEIIEVTEL